jgi:hypothetical protein
VGVTVEPLAPPSYDKDWTGTFDTHCPLERLVARTAAALTPVNRQAMGAPQLNELPASWQARAVLGEAVTGDQRMSDPTFKVDQLASLKDSHIAPFNNLVEELGSRDDGGSPPWIAPMYFGRESRVLCVLRDPGKRADAAAGSGFLCVENTDETSRRQKRMMLEAGIDPREMLPWNAYP